MPATAWQWPLSGSALNWQLQPYSQLQLTSSRPLISQAVMARLQDKSCMDRTTAPGAVNRPGAGGAPAATWLAGRLCQRRGAEMPTLWPGTCSAGQAWHHGPYNGGDQGGAHHAAFDAFEFVGVLRYCGLRCCGLHGACYSVLRWRGTMKLPSPDPNRERHHTAAHA